MKKSLTALSVLFLLLAVLFTFISCNEDDTPTPDDENRDGVTSETPEESGDDTEADAPADNPTNTPEDTPSDTPSSPSDMGSGSNVEDGKSDSDNGTASSPSGNMPSDTPLVDDKPSFIG